MEWVKDYLSSDLCINFTREMQFFLKKMKTMGMCSSDHPPNREANFYGIALGE